MSPDNLLRIHNPGIPDPNLLTEVSVRNGCGYFPGLDPEFKHGFLWERPRNIAYMSEPGYLSENPEVKRNATLGVRKNVRDFLRAIDIDSFENLVIGGASAGDMRISYITSELVKASKMESYERGHYIEGGAFFVDEPGIPVYTIAGDCAWAFIQAKRPEKTPVVGIAHAGRVEIEQEFPKTVINYLEETHGCDPAMVKVGIMPSLEPKHHSIRFDTVEKDIKHLTAWEHYMVTDPVMQRYYLDVRSWYADQLIEAGVSPANIDLTLVGTFESAQQGYGFSHRLALTKKIRSLRSGVAFELAS